VLDDDDERAMAYRHPMTERRILDLRAGVPWSVSDLKVLTLAAGSAWGNPQHPSSEGRRAATWLEAAAASIRNLTGLPHIAFFPDRLSALRAALAQHPEARVTTSATHRKQVLSLAQSVVPVDDHGIPAWVPSQLTILQAANEETGAVDPAPPAGITVVDASNTFGRVPLAQHAEYVVADGAVWGSPAGVALLLSQTPVTVREVPPLPLVAVAVQSLVAAWQTMHERSASEGSAMTKFEAQVRRAIPDVQFHAQDPVPHIRSFSILHLDAETLTSALDAQGYVVGSGSACVSDGTPSHVLAAMGRVTHGNIRLALPVDTDLRVLDEFAETLTNTVARLRREAGVEGL
jgi:cysteine desulfurase